MKVHKREFRQITHNFFFLRVATYHHNVQRLLQHYAFELRFFQSKPDGLRLMVRYFPRNGHTLQPRFQSARSNIQRKEKYTGQQVTNKSDPDHERSRKRPNVDILIAALPQRELSTLSGVFKLRETLSGGNGEFLCNEFIYH